MFIKTICGAFFYLGLITSPLYAHYQMETIDVGFLEATAPAGAEELHTEILSLNKNGLAGGFFTYLSTFTEKRSFIFDTQSKNWTWLTGHIEGLNDHNQVLLMDAGRPYLWEAGQERKLIEIPHVAGELYGMKLNNLGQVLVKVQTVDDSFDYYLWEENADAVRIPLEALPYSNDSMLTFCDLNDSGEVLFALRYYDQNQVGFCLFSGDQLLKYCMPKANSNQAWTPFALNNAGDIFYHVDNAGTDYDPEHRNLYATPVMLLKADGQTTIAVGNGTKFVNSVSQDTLLGTHVNGKAKSSKDLHAAIWSPIHGRQLLKDLTVKNPWHLITAKCMNAQGQIIVYGSTKERHFNIFLLSPISD